MPIIGVGSKVIAVTSSVKKGTGPRRGSIGYISDISTNTTYAGHGVFVQPVKIVFTRYGFESKTRKERKPFINMLPIMRKNTAHDYMKKTEGVDTTTLFWARMKSVLTRPAGRSRIAHGILVPLEADLMKCGSEEFNIWLGSHILSRKFYDAMYLITSNNKKLDGVIDTEITNTLLAMASNKNLRSIWMKACQEGPNSRELKKLLIKTIRQITSINFRNSCFDKAKTLKCLMRRDTASIGGVLVNNYYIDSEYYWKKNLILGGKRIAKNTEFYIDHLTKTRKELRCLARTYERGHVQINKM
jgi:hypothetical protein